LYEGHMREIRDRYARDDYVREEGKVEGKAEAVLELLSSKGPISEELEQKIRRQQDMDILRSWLLAAAAVETVREFEEKSLTNDSANKDNNDKTLPLH
ncbi:MAG: hypothetical protein NC517_00645, partial [Firmicutes bacterium]|nr:hypothetical protein [Bacillota bacterium]